MLDLLMSDPGSFQLDDEQESNRVVECDVIWDTFLNSEHKTEGPLSLDIDIVANKSQKAQRIPVKLLLAMQANSCYSHRV